MAADDGNPPISLDIKEELDKQLKEMRRHVSTLTEKIADQIKELTTLREEKDRRIVMIQDLYKIIRTHEDYVYLLRLALSKDKP